MSLRPKSPADLERLLDRADAGASTAWEMDFAADMREQCETGKTDFTEKQWTKLWEIAEGDC
jgi:hypothetical protein